MHLVPPGVVTRAEVLHAPTALVVIQLGLFTLEAMHAHLMPKSLRTCSVG